MGAESVPDLHDGLLDRDDYNRSAAEDDDEAAVVEAHVAAGFQEVCAVAGHYGCWDAGQSTRRGDRRI